MLTLFCISALTGSIKTIWRVSSNSSKTSSSELMLIDLLVSPAANIIVPEVTP